MVPAAQSENVTAQYQARYCEKCLIIAIPFQSEQLLCFHFAATFKEVTSIKAVTILSVYHRCYNENGDQSFVSAHFFVLLQTNEMYIN